MIEWWFVNTFEYDYCLEKEEVWCNALWKNKKQNQSELNLGTNQPASNLMQFEILFHEGTSFFFYIETLHVNWKKYEVPILGFDY